MDPQPREPLIILGAGLAGLSLATALREAGCRRPITLIDRRSGWGCDRTWCTWQTGPRLRFSELATHRWWAWRARWRGQETIKRTRRHPYLHLPADVVYGVALDRLLADPDVTLRTRERVLGVAPASDDGDRAIVTTSRERFEAAVVFDALGPGSPLLARRHEPDEALTQRFLGWEIETDRPAFKPEAATLMDFCAGPAGSACFWYLLPFSPTRALLEHTSIGRGPAAVPDRRELLETEVGQRVGRAGWRRLREEQGAIPMSLALEPSRVRAVWPVGAAAGAIRPSSGYAFSRTQRHVDAIAARLTSGLSPDVPVARRDLQVLDRAFLQALGGRDDGGAQLFWKVIAQMPADAFARFMTDAASPADLALAIAAAPVVPMLSALAGAVPITKPLANLSRRLGIGR